MVSAIEFEQEQQYLSFQGLELRIRHLEKSIGKPPLVDEKKIFDEPSSIEEEETGTKKTKTVLALLKRVNEVHRKLRAVVREKEGLRAFLEQCMVMILLYHWQETYIYGSGRIKIKRVKNSFSIYIYIYSF